MREELELVGGAALAIDGTHSASGLVSDAGAALEARLHSGRLRDSAMYEELPRASHANGVAARGAGRSRHDKNELAGGSARADAQERAAGGRFSAPGKVPRPRVRLANGSGKGRAHVVHEIDRRPDAPLLRLLRGASRGSVGGRSHVGR